VRNYIWEVALQYLMEQLADAYANIKKVVLFLAFLFLTVTKCTSEGRAMMSLDFKVLLNGLEKLSPIK
jgi:hypothetical protein